MSGSMGVCNIDLPPDPLQYLEAALGEDIQHLWPQLVTVFIEKLVDLQRQSLI